MLTIDDLSIDSVSGVGYSDYKFAMRGTQGFGQWYGGYMIVDNGEYCLFLKEEQRGILLENGTQINGKGYLIAREVPGKPYKIGIAFYPYTGKYSDLSDSYKETVIQAWNETIQGEEAETTEEVERYQSRNERGETLAEQRAREEREAEEKVAQEEEDARTPLNEDNVIRQEEFVLTSWGVIDTIEEGQGLTRTTELKIIEQKRGTVKNPSVSYLVQEINPSAQDYGRGANVLWEQGADTQDEAEELFDSRKNQITQEFTLTAEESEAERIANTPTLEKFENINFEWVESTNSFQQMLTNTSPDWSAPANQGLWQRQIGAGAWSDAIFWSNGGNTLNLEDFDTPRITSEGISENKSGAVGFTVYTNWRITFELETDSSLSFINRGKPDSVDKSANSFTFTMYAGDRLEIDIDNEREDLGPFFISIKGNEWFSAEEPDDEIRLTMVKAEQLRVTVDNYWAWILPDGSERTDIERTSEVSYESHAWGSTVPQTHYSKLKENEEYLEVQSATRDRISPTVKAESSFVSPEDIGEDIGDAAGKVTDAVTGGIWDRFKWPIIIGGVVIVGLAVFAIWMRTKKPAPAPAPAPTPVQVVKS